MLSNIIDLFPSFTLADVTLFPLRAHLVIASLSFPQETFTVIEKVAWIAALAAPMNYDVLRAVC